MIEAIVFDMDGILFDTERLSVESWIEVAERLGLPDIDKGVYGCIGLNRTDCRIFSKKPMDRIFPMIISENRQPPFFSGRWQRTAFLL